LKFILLVVLALTALTVTTIFPVSDWILFGSKWIDENQVLAGLTYITAYTIATILVIPGTILTVTAGFLFGIPLGIAIVSAGSLSGACCSFLISRFFARDWVSNKFIKFPLFNALDTASKEKGFLIILLARLSPLFPYNILNYALGLTAVTFKNYILASWIGMAPGITIYVSIGAATKNISGLASSEIQYENIQQLFFIAGLVATLILLTIVMRMANKTLHKKLDRTMVDSPD
tara:strand:- start:24 stop:722 length:699 start_codon:yes stop_codon:yes gene_type:complete